MSFLDTYHEARRMVEERGGLTLRMVDRLREAGYPLHQINELVTIWNRIKELSNS